MRLPTVTRPAPLAARRRPLASYPPRGLLEAALAGFAGLVVGYAVVRKGTGVGLALVCVLPFVAFVIRRPGNAVALAAGLVAVVPYWWTVYSPQLSIPRAALVLAAAGLVMGFQRGIRVRVPDVALAALAIVFVLSFDSAIGVPRGILIETIASIAFYAIGRWAGTESTTRLVLWAIGLAGAVGGLSVIFEYFVTQAPLVADGGQYGWQQDATYIYRPGGLYGSPPGAVAALAISAICIFPLIARERRWLRVLAVASAVIAVVAIVLTFTRAGWIAFGIGAICYAVLSADAIGRRTQALVAAAALIGAIALLVLPSFSGSEVYQKGVNRGGTLQAREGYWQLALPLVDDSAAHLAVGRGFGALLSGDSGGRIDSGLMTAPQVTISGTHNQYVRTLVEHGAIGLGLLLTWLGGAVAIMARQARLARGDVRRMSAALAGATISFLIVSLANDTFRDVQTMAMVALVAGLGVTVGARAREARA